MFEWIFISGLLVAFYNAWGIGANDCANSFSTSVGAKVLTLNQAIIVAGFFEFSGAVLMGSQVTDTVRKTIVDIDIFRNNPGVLMLGMLCANLSSAIWLTMATYFKLPVSTTHSIIGGILGFSLVYGSKTAIKWKKIIFIFSGWIISPLLAGIISYVIFWVSLKFIFKSKKPYEYTLILFPILTFFTFFINVLFIIYKGTPNLDLDKIELWKCMLISISVGLVTALMSQFIYLPYIKKKINEINTINENEEGITEIQENTRTDSYINTIENIENNENNYIYSSDKSLEFNIKEAENYTQKLKDNKNNKQIDTLHDNAFVIEPKSEKLCNWIQIITACFSSFAHGSNDVANSIAPLATIYSIYKNDNIVDKSEVPIWILLLGGIGIVFGLATWGYKIINRMGKELTKVTPSRGFIIELAAATTVIIASRAKIPVSTTHCQVGSILGCGMVGGTKNIQWKLLKSILFSWLITLPVTGIISALLFSFGYYSPHSFYIYNSNSSLNSSLNSSFDLNYTTNISLIQ